jgi:hypothetical protein
MRSKWIDPRWFSEASLLGPRMFDRDLTERRRALLTNVRIRRGAKQGLDLLRRGFFSALVKAEAGQNPGAGCWFTAGFAPPNVRDEHSCLISHPEKSTTGFRSSEDESK